MTKDFTNETKETLRATLQQLENNVQDDQRIIVRSTFYREHQVVVVGTSHYGRRVLIVLYSNREIRTDRDPGNVSDHDHT